MAQWTPASEEVARECESLFQNGGPRVYVRYSGETWLRLRPVVDYGAARALDLYDPGDTIYTRRKQRGARRYTWMQSTIPTPAPKSPRYGVRIGANWVAELVPNPNPMAPGTMSPYTKDAAVFGNRESANMAAADWACKNLGVGVEVRNLDTFAVVAKFCQYADIAE